MKQTWHIKLAHATANILMYPMGHFNTTSPDDLELYPGYPDLC